MTAVGIVGRQLVTTSLAVFSTQRSPPGAYLDSSVKRKNETEVQPSYERTMVYLRRVLVIPPPVRARVKAARSAPPEAAWALTRAERGGIRRLGFRSPSTLILRGGTASDCKRIFGPSREHARLRATMVNARGDANRWYGPVWPAPVVGVSPRRSDRCAILSRRQSSWRDYGSVVTTGLRRDAGFQPQRVGRHATPSGPAGWRSRRWQCSPRGARQSRAPRSRNGVVFCGLPAVGQHGPGAMHEQGAEIAVALFC